MTQATPGPRRRYAGVNLEVAHQAEQNAVEEVVFGFWVFLMSDALLFALLFSVYQTLLRGTASGPTGHALFKMAPALIETLTLLTSSFTFGIASLMMKHQRSTALLQGLLSVTLLLGLSFLGLELHDFFQFASKGALPQRSGFLSAFYVLLATHFIHVLIGCIWIVVMLIQLRLFGLDSGVKTRLLRLGLFWHFLDIVWVFIFSFVYLQGLL